MANASMRDVAARAGVSVATVSHVINNTRYVAEGTRERVQAAIEGLNYNPDTMARIFKTGRTNLVGFVVPNISDPFFSTLIEEVESVLSRQNYRLVVTNSHEDEQREIENLRFLCNGLVDGIIIASAQRSYESIQKVLPENFPIVFIDRTVAFCPKDVIRVNTYSTVLEATEDFIRKGHSKIVCFQNSPYLSTCVERLDAYRDAIHKHGLEPNIIPLVNTLSTQLELYLDQVMACGASVLIAPNNITSMASARYFYRHNITVGKDIELVAFQDVPEPNILLSNASLIKQPVLELGRTAAKRILERINKPDLPITETVLQSNYIPRP